MKEGMNKYDLMNERLTDNLFSGMYIVFFFAFRLLIGVSIAIFSVQPRASGNYYANHYFKYYFQRQFVTL